jgi:hypothetical protein
MKPEEVVVRGLLGVMHFFAIFAIASTLTNAGLAWYVIVFWCLTALFLGLLFGTFFSFFPKSWAGYFIALAIGTALIAVALQQHIIPICGDNVCSATECSSCSEDCTPGQCSNGICDLTERCDNSKDCVCTSGTTCAPRRPGASPRGCIEITCGDNYCDATESEGCCIDCACAPGFDCIKNVCLFEQPRISVTPYIAAPALSATTLAGNPFLTNETGGSKPLLAIKIETTKSIYNLNANFALKNVNATVQLGNMLPGQNKTAFFYLRSDPRFLVITQDENVNISVQMTYYDLQNERHVVTKQVPFTILARKSSDPFNHILLYTTRTIVPRAKTVQGIWDEFRQNMTMVDHSGTQFPLETMIKRTANQRDMAALLYSAYLNAGLKPSIMENYQGVFLRVPHIDGNVIIDPSRVNVTFDKAITTGPGFTLSDERTRSARNFTFLSLNASYIPGANTHVETQLDTSCAGSLRVVVLHTLRNDGEVTERICATSRIFGPGILDEKRECYTLLPQHEDLLRHSYTNNICAPVQASVVMESS